MLDFFNKIIHWYNKQTDSIKIFIWVGLIAFIGIIIRGHSVIDGIKKGFEFYFK